MASGQVNVEIPESLVRPVIEAEVIAAITKAMGSQNNLIAECVKRALSVKTNLDGNVANYSSENKYGLVEVIAYKSINAMVKQVVANWVEENKGLIEEAVKKELSKRPTPMAKALVNCFAEYVKHGNYKVTLGIEPHERY